MKEPSTDAEEGNFRMLFVLGVLLFFAKLAMASSDDLGQGTALHSQFPTELGEIIFFTQVREIRIVM